MAERHQLLAHFDRQMLRCLYEAVPVDNEQLLLHMLRRHVDLRVDSDRLPVGTLAESWLRQGLVQPEAVPGGLRCCPPWILSPGRCSCVKSKTRNPA